MSNSYRGIECTLETAEPLGVSPPEAVDLFQIKGKLKVVRTEALRAGFKDCWQKGHYTTIVQMAKRVPEAVIQEDPALLMYYDNALMRKGE